MSGLVRKAAAAILLLVAGWFAVRAFTRVEPVSSAPSGPAADVAGDDRVAWLLEPCTQGGPYDVDTSNTAAILEEALLHGQRDPLRRAREELAREGAAGLAVARRLIDEHWVDPQLRIPLLNAMDVVALSEDPGAHEVLARVLTHPDEQMRLRALKALRRRGPSGALVQGRPDDFDAVIALLPHATEVTQSEILQVAHDLDPERADELFTTWLRDKSHPEHWLWSVAMLAGTTRPDSVAFITAHWREFDAPFQPYLAAPAARAGDAEALAAFEPLLADADPNVRLAALRAAESAHLASVLERALRTDPDCGLRLIAARALAKEPDAPAIRAALAATTSDACNDLRFTCLELLCARRDPAAIDRALAMLAEPVGLELEISMRALLAPMRSDPELANRVLERLLARDAKRSSLPAGEVAQLLQAIGQVPLARATQHLLDLAHVHTGSIQGFRANRWLVLQSVNTGPVAAPLLAAELAAERDPLARLDLIEAISALASEAGRAELLEFVQSDGAAPLEIVYAAERLVASGPAKRVAPVLKRVALRMQDAVARRALQCLLWRAYPGPR